MLFGSSTSCRRETPNPTVVRIVEGVRGSVQMRMELALRFDYGAIVPWVRNRRGHAGRHRRPGRGLAARPRSSSRGVTCERTPPSRSSEGDRVPFVLTWFPSNKAVPAAVRRGACPFGSRRLLGGLGAALHMTREVARAVIRSLLTLKALSSRRREESSPRRRPRCRRRSVACATGTTATAGSAMQR